MVNKTQSVANHMYIYVVQVEKCAKSKQCVNLGQQTHVRTFGGDEHSKVSHNYATAQRPLSVVQPHINLSYPVLPLFVHTYTHVHNHKHTLKITHTDTHTTYIPPPLHKKERKKKKRKKVNNNIQPSYATSKNNFK